MNQYDPNNDEYAIQAILELEAEEQDIEMMENDLQQEALEEKEYEI